MPQDVSAKADAVDDTPASAVGRVRLGLSRWPDPARIGVEVRRAGTTGKRPGRDEFYAQPTYLPVRSDVDLSSFADRMRPAARSGRIRFALDPPGERPSTARFCPRRCQRGFGAVPGKCLAARLPFAGLGVVFRTLDVRLLPKPVWLSEHDARRNQCTRNGSIGSHSWRQ